jgi:hypothetical protein
MRNYLIIGLFMMLLVMTNGCSTPKSVHDINQKVSILLPYIALDESRFFMNAQVIRDFYSDVEIFNQINNHDFGVEIIGIDAATYDDYVDQVMTLMLSDQPPDLVFDFSQYSEKTKIYSLSNDLLKVGYFQPIEYDKLSTELLPGFKDMYYIATNLEVVGYLYDRKEAQLIGKNFLDRLTMDDKVELMDAWLKEKDLPLTRTTYQQIMEMYFPIKLFVDLDSKEIFFDIEKILDRASNLKDKYQGEEFVGPVGLSTVDACKYILGDDYLLKKEWINEIHDGLWLPRYDDYIYYPTSTNFYIDLDRYEGRGVLLLDDADYFRTSGYYINHQSNQLDQVYSFLDFVSSNGDTSVHVLDSLKELKVAQFEKDRVISFYQRLQAGDLIYLNKDYPYYDELAEKFSRLLLEYIVDKHKTSQSFERNLKQIENELIFKAME